jgi:RND family efflux transporter MFP subunit
MSQIKTPPQTPPTSPRSNRVEPEIPPHGSAPMNAGDHGEPGVPTDLKTPGGFSVAIAVLAFVVLLAVLFLVGEIPAYREEHQVQEEAVARSKQLPVVQYTMLEPSPDTSDVVLPCNISANQTVAIYTRSTGYLEKFNYDIGQYVKKDDDLAVIATPDVDAQLAQSKATVVQDEANVKRSEADLELAKVTYARYVKAQKQSPGSVTQEDVDTRKSAVDDAEAALAQSKATVAAANADVDRLNVLVGFEHVKAPFSGKVTARNYYAGALLTPSSTPEIFDLQQTDLLRVFINVPQEYANDVKIGDKVKLFVRNFPSKPFLGEVALTAGAVDPNTRTLRVQINYDNRDNQLFPGEYGEVHLPVAQGATIGLIPTSALVFNAQATGNQVATVDGDGKVHMKSIKTGRDFGTSIEVTGGLTDTDKIITNPSERVIEGAKVDYHLSPNAAVPASQPVKTPPTTMPG